VQLNPKRPTNKGPAERFTGEVYVDPVARGPEPSRVQINSVHFTPGARSAWHSHGSGQTLWVTEGVGRVQTRGEAIVEIRAGDVVTTPPDEQHWHGAAPEQFMTHVSITENLPDHPDMWGDHVSDAEYNGRATRPDGA